MLHFVLDTNIVVSALLFQNSIPRKAFDKALDTGKILVSRPVIVEVTQVLSRKKFNKYLLEEERMKFLRDFLQETELIEITETITDCRDEKDNKILELAVSGKANYIITGDEDLLILNPFRGILIIKPKEFLLIDTDA